MFTRITACLFGSALVGLLAGCAGLGSGIDESALSARLPEGVTLLDSEEENCSGTVQIMEAGHRGEGLVLRSGQNATIALDEDERVNWTCVGGATSDTERIDCPDDTSYIRLSRAGQGNDLLLECYGRRRSG